MGVPGAREDGVGTVTNEIAGLAFELHHPQSPVKELRIAMAGEGVARFPVVVIGVEEAAELVVERPEAAADAGKAALALEDILHLSQMPKYEEYEGSVYMVVPMVEPLHKDISEVSPESFVFDQVSLFWGKNFVLTFQERPGDVFDNVRERATFIPDRRVTYATDGES